MQGAQHLHLALRRRLSMKGEGQPASVVGGAKQGPGRGWRVGVGERPAGERSISASRRAAAWARARGNASPKVSECWRKHETGREQRSS